MANIDLTRYGITGTTEIVYNPSYELLFKYGLEAKIASEQKVMTKALNTIIEVNTLMSGMGFENGGSASDHSFWFTALALPGREEWALHGEGVSFSCCCQLVMENVDVEELDKVYSFLVSVGLPVTFDDLHIYDITDDEIRLMAKNMSNNPKNYNHPFECTEEVLYGAIKTADTLGKMYKAGGRLI